VQEQNQRLKKTNLALRKALRSVTVEQERAVGSSQTSGTVIWFNDDQGFGFLRPDNSGKDVYVKAPSAVNPDVMTLADGQRVSFQIVEDEAENVILL